MFNLPRWDLHRWAVKIRQEVWAQVLLCVGLKLVSVWIESFISKCNPTLPYSWRSHLVCYSMMIDVQTSLKHWSGRWEPQRSARFWHMRVSYCSKEFTITWKLFSNRSQQQHQLKMSQTLDYALLPHPSKFQQNASKLGLLWVGREYYCNGCVSGDKF